ncbi:MAG TPA: ArsR family transcriptional regulator [Iamia sp.]
MIPLFRTDAQARILAVLFERRGVSRPLGQVARRAGVPMSTASREVDRLVESGLVTVEKAGRMRIVSANWDLPWAEELASILSQTVGIDGRIARALSDVPGIDEAFLFGSWVGTANPNPNDIDLLIVGRPDRRAVRDALRPIEDTIHLYLNPTIIDPSEWEHDGPFVATVRDRPLRKLALGDPG